MAPDNRATHNAWGEQKSVGATSNTTSGRQEICRNIAGQLPSEKLNRCSTRFQLRGALGTQTGHRNTSIVPGDPLGDNRSRLDRHAECPSKTRHCG
jgi:hypothetical protein